MRSDTVIKLKEKIIGKLGKSKEVE